MAAADGLTEVHDRLEATWQRVPDIERGAAVRLDLAVHLSSAPGRVEVAAKPPASPVTASIQVQMSAGWRVN